MPFRKPVTGAQLLEALQSMTPDELSLPIQFMNEPIHPRITLVVNDLSEDQQDHHISFVGSFRYDADDVRVVRVPHAEKGKTHKERREAGELLRRGRSS